MTELVEVFLDAPRYTAVVFGSLLEPALGRRITQIAGIMSGVTLLVAAALFLAGPPLARLSGPMVLLVALAWFGVFGLLRLAVTGVMWFTGEILSLVEDAVPSLTGVCQFLFRAYWVLWETALIGLFFGFHVLALGLPVVDVGAIIS